MPCLVLGNPPSTICFAIGLSKPQSVPKTRIADNLANTCTAEGAVGAPSRQRAIVPPRVRPKVRRPLLHPHSPADAALVGAKGGNVAWEWLQDNSVTPCQC